MGRLRVEFYFEEEQNRASFTAFLHTVHGAEEPSAPPAEGEEPLMALEFAGELTEEELSGSIRRWMADKKFGSKDSISVFFR